MLAEELINGIEITVPILGGKALPVVAIFPPENEEFDLDNKYNGRTKEVCPVTNEILSENLQKEAMDIALTAHNAVGARHLSRVDMIVSADNKIVVLEINTMPGLTTQSLYPKSAEAAGLNFEQLVKTFVQISCGENLINWYNIT
jgi:D-alanine--D-alanine ligase